MIHVFLRPGIISLRGKMTPRSIVDVGRYFLRYTRMTFVSLFRFSRVNGDKVDLNQKCYGVRIYIGAEYVIFCFFI